VGVSNYPRKAKKAASRRETTLVILLARLQVSHTHSHFSNIILLAKKFCQATEFAKTFIIYTVPKLTYCTYM
jgi:hypothetical protein